MHAQPLVSIITPSFNKGPYLEETILSIRNQTYKNIEHIVIDGGSTDETLSILRKYDNDLTWISEPDNGQSDAINKGWRQAKGDIIAYLNADDTYLPDAIETAVLFFKTHPDSVMVYGEGIASDEFGKNQRLTHCGEFSLKNLVFCQDNIFQPSVFLRKTVLDTVGEIDATLHLAMDLDYWLRIAVVHTIDYIGKPLSVAKIYQDAKSAAYMHRYVVEYDHILEKLFADPRLSPEILAWKKDAYTFVYAKGGLDYLHAWMVKEGLRYVWKSFRMSPAGCMNYSAALILQYATGKPVVIR